MNLAINLKIGLRQQRAMTVHLKYNPSNLSLRQRASLSRANRQAKKLLKPSKHKGDDSCTNISVKSSE